MAADPLAHPADGAGGLTNAGIQEQFMQLAKDDILQGMTMKQSVEHCYAMCPPLRSNPHFRQLYPKVFIETVRLMDLMKKEDEPARITDISDEEEQTPTNSAEVPDKSAEVPDKSGAEGPANEAGTDLYDETP